MPHTLKSLLPQINFPSKSFAHLVEALAEHPDFATRYRHDPVKALRSVGVAVPPDLKFPRPDPFRWKADPREPDNDGGGGGGGGGGPAIPALSAEDVQAGANVWGIVFTLSHDAATAVSTSTTIISQLVSLAGSVFPPASFATGLVSAFLSLNAELIKKVDIGNGVYLTIPWLLPGVVVPTSR